MSAPSVHDDWLSLVEISGPFPRRSGSERKSFHQGPGRTRCHQAANVLRQAYEEWREALELEDIQFAELHDAWIDEVLSAGPRAR